MKPEQSKDAVERSEKPELSDEQKYDIGKRLYERICRNHWDFNGQRKRYSRSVGLEKLSRRNNLSKYGDVAADFLMDLGVFQEDLGADPQECLFRYVDQARSEEIHGLYEAIVHSDRPDVQELCWKIVKGAEEHIWSSELQKELAVLSGAEENISSEEMYKLAKLIEKERPKEIRDARKQAKEREKAEEKKEKARLKQEMKDFRQQQKEEARIRKETRGERVPKMYEALCNCKDEELPEALWRIVNYNHPALSEGPQDAFRAIYGLDIIPMTQDIDVDDLKALRKLIVRDKRTLQAPKGMAEYLQRYDAAQKNQEGPTA